MLVSIVNIVIIHICTATTSNQKKKKNMKKICLKNI